MHTEIDHNERVERQRLGNLKVAMTLPMSYIKSIGGSLEEFAIFMVDKLISGWTEVNTPKQLSDAIGLNAESFGADIIFHRSTERESEIIISDFIEREYLDFIGLKIEDYDKFYLFFEFLATRLGMDLNWKREDDLIVINISKHEKID